MRSRIAFSRLPRLPRKVVATYEKARYAFDTGRARTVSPEARFFSTCYRTRRLESKTVLYQAHTGAGMVCNPYAIFRALLTDPEFAGYTHVWVLDSEPEITLRSREYAGHPNVRFVRFKSREYLRALATAAYLIQNTSFPSFFVKRPGQVYVNTWHSAGAVKRMGFDLPDGTYSSRNVIRNLLMADFIISPNALMTRVFAESYRLRGLFPGKILEFGYPRNDVTLTTSRLEVVAELQARGVVVDPTKKIILYAPTWRGTISNIRGGSASLEQFRDGLAAGIDLDQYQILIKPHQYHYSRLTPEQKRSGLYIPRQFNANRLLAAVDILVSDYSSIFFDFMVTDRPILFYIPDKLEYAAERGVYYSWDELPGPTTDRVSEIASWVTDIEKVFQQHRERYDRMKAVACEHEDGRAADRAVDAIFRDRMPAGVIDDYVDPDRKRILIYVRDLSRDGVAGPLLALLPRIDRSIYDVTVASIGATAGSRDNAEKIKDARVLMQAGSPVLTVWEAVGFAYLSRYGWTGPMARLLRPEAALRREFSRCFGQSQFDTIIDFSDYPGVFPWMARQSPDSKLIVWQHTEIQADLENRQKWRLVGTNAPPMTRAGLMSVYGAADAVVSTSAPLAEINRARIATATTRKRFTHSDSLVDTRRVHDLLAESDEWAHEGATIVADVAVDGDHSQRTLALPDHPPAPESGEPYLKFVTMGSLSPEKNAESLVLAFSDLVQEHPNSRLFIIGEGPLEADLRRLIEWPELRQRVCFTGHLRNPFAVIRRCDCFVLPSRYEGFNLSVPEVRLLELPIILGDFATAGAASVPGGQLVVGTTREEILEGLQAFVAGAVPSTYEFDVDAHNERAVEQFHRLLAST